jgi:hypothetical protein
VSGTEQWFSEEVEPAFEKVKKAIAEEYKAEYLRQYIDELILHLNFLKGVK